MRETKRASKRSVLVACLTFLALVSLPGASCEVADVDDAGSTPDAGVCRRQPAGDVERCTLVSVADCLDVDGCMRTSAYRYSDEEACYTLERLCVDEPEVSSPDQAFAIAPDGTCWQFGSGFPIPGWFVPDDNRGCCPEVVECESVDGG